VFFFSSRRRHTRLVSDWSSDVCSSDLYEAFNAGCFARSGVASLRALPSQCTIVPIAPKNQQLSHVKQVPVVMPPPPRATVAAGRSEERRVGKEGRSRGARGA